MQEIEWSLFKHLIQLCLMKESALLMLLKDK